MSSLDKRTPGEALNAEEAVEQAGFAPPPEGGWFGERSQELAAEQAAVTAFFGQLPDAGDVDC